MFFPQNDLTLPISIFTFFFSLSMFLNKDEQVGGDEKDPRCGHEFYLPVRHLRKMLLCCILSNAYYVLKK